MDATTYKKLNEYAAELGKLACRLDKDGEKALAIEKYLKLIDVLLVVADAAPSYPSWVKLADRAQAYQKRVKQLMAETVTEPERTPADALATRPVSNSKPSPLRVSS